MGNLATVAQLAEVLGVELESDDERALRALRDATSFVRLRTGQRIELVQDDVVELMGSYDPELWLPQIPVKVLDDDDEPLTSVAIRHDGESVFTDLDPVGFTVGRNGRMYRGGGWWGGRGAVRVTYTHGYDPAVESQAEVLEQVATLTLGIAKRYYARVPAGVTQRQIGTFSETYGDQGAMGLTQDEADLLERLSNPWG